jgi:hypothetical protein
MQRFASIVFSAGLLVFNSAGHGAELPDAAGSKAIPQAISQADAQGARAAIQAQLKAFAADDAQRAFSLATPQLRQVFGTPENFIAMVRRGYPVVYRPASVAFLKPERDGEALVQAVHMTDADGVLWLALYHLERQPDKSWRISGCQVVEAKGQVT